MVLMLAICSPQPNWMPKNPKLMFQISQNDSRGLVWVSTGLPAEGDSIQFPGLTCGFPEDSW